MLETFPKKGITQMIFCAVIDSLVVIVCCKMVRCFSGMFRMILIMSLSYDCVWPSDSSNKIFL